MFSQYNLYTIAKEGSPICPLLGEQIRGMVHVYIQRNTQLFQKILTMLTKQIDLDDIRLSGISQI